MRKSYIEEARAPMGPKSSDDRSFAPCSDRAIFYYGMLGSLPACIVLSLRLWLYITFAGALAKGKSVCGTHMYK